MVDAAGTSTQVVSAPVIATAADPPLNTSPPLISGTPKPGNVLTCAKGTWTGDQPQTYSYQWLRDGVGLLPAAVHTMLVPGIMLVLAVLGINVFGDGVRDALDPRAKIRIEH